MRKLRVEHLESRHLLSAAGGLTVLLPLPPIIVSPGAATVAPLVGVCQTNDGSHAVTQLSVVAETDASIFARPPGVLPPAMLLLQAAGDAPASATDQLTLRQPTCRATPRNLF